MENMSAKIIVLFNFVVTLSVIAQETPSEQREEWTPSYGFPSVAVVKLDDKNVLQILLPSATVPNPNGSTFTVQYFVEENGVQVSKERTQPEYLLDKFRMVRTHLSGDKIKLRDQSGKILDFDQISKSTRKSAYVLLVQQGIITPWRKHYIREDVWVLSPQDLDPNCWHLPEVVGLAPKWVRTEPMPKTAVAQLVENATKVEVVYVRKENSSEVTTQEFIDIDECVFSTADGKDIAKQAAIARLSQPCHILWESIITEYLGSVVKPDTLIVNRISSKTNNAR